MSAPTKSKKSWSYLKEAPKQPKGPAKPWDPQVEQKSEEFVSFLKDSENKAAFQDIVIDAFKKYEQETIARYQARMENEKRVNQNTLGEFHRAGNLEPMLHEALSMADAERAFGRGIRNTKEGLVHTLDNRVDEINRLLANIGGFSAQIKSSFARSTVVFLEQEDPKYNYRERLIFSINLPNFELKRPWETKKDGTSQSLPDGRTSLQATWDDAINALARTVEKAGLRPKYCKNDRHYGRFVMRQDLRSVGNLPDEYFSFTLDYNTAEKIEEMKAPYNQIVSGLSAKVERLRRKMARYPEQSSAPTYLALKKQFLDASQERDFFIGTTPDPNQMDEGLLFLIEVSTLKDYHLVKDRMQSIMTRYILYLSKIAAAEAEFDPELEYQMIMSQKVTSPGTAGGKDTTSDGSLPELSVSEVEELPQYEIDPSMLRKVDRKKKAA